MSFVFRPPFAKSSLGYSCHQSRVGTEVLALKTITFLYDQPEDRILAVVNANSEKAWSCWLTRRLVLGLLPKLTEFMTRTSKLVQRGATEARAELARFEREAALVETAGSLSMTPRHVTKAKASTAELLTSITLNSVGRNFQIQLSGAGGGGAAASVKRSDVQRILQLLQDATVKAGWSDNVGGQLAQATKAIVRH
jgi:hypothetical protein